MTRDEFIARELEARHRAWLPRAGVLGAGLLLALGLILLTRRGEEFRLLSMANFVLVAILGTGLGLRSLVQRLLVRDLGLRYDLVAEKERSERRFSAFMDRLPGLATLRTPDGELVYANRLHRDLAARASGSLLTPDPRIHAAEARLVLEEGGFLEREATTQEAGDARHWVEMAFPVPDEQGRPALVARLALEVTERRRMEELLRQGKQDWESVFDALTDMVTVHDSAFNIVRANRAAVENLGLPFEMLTREKCFRCYHGADAPPESCSSCASLRTGAASTTEFYEPHLGKFLEMRAIPRRAEDGRVLGLVHVVRDITAARRAAEELHASEERLRTMVASAPFGTHLYDLGADGRLTLRLANPAADRILGVGHESLQGRGVDDALPGLAGTPVPVVFRRIAEKGGTWDSGQVSYARGDARTILEVHAFQAGPGRLAVFFTDVTERAEAEARVQRHLRQVEALRTIDLAIGSSFDLAGSLPVVLEQITCQLAVDAAAILIADPADLTLARTASRGFRREGRAGAAPPARIDEGPAGMAVRERRMIAVPVLGARDSCAPAGEGFACAWFVPLLAKGRVHGVLEIFHRRPLDPAPGWLSFLETLAGQAAIAVDNALLFRDLERSNADLRLAYETTILGWSRALDYRDQETEGHSQRVTDLTVRVARHLGVGEDDLVHIRRGALLHDIGKLGVPDGILSKPGPLTAEEWVLMRRHPQIAFELLSPISHLARAIDIPWCHHERWDGTGYPRGLRGEQIPLAVRIFSVIDVWDALTSERPYREAWPAERVCEELRRGAGSLFDPAVVEPFIALMGHGAAAAAAAAR